MAEVTAMRSNALPYPVYGAPWTVVFPMLDADGDLVTGATTPDSEVSKNGDTFADCTNEATEIATSSGIYYLTLTATEMTADIVAVIAKSATSGMKTTPIVLYPRKLVELASGTAQGGAAGYITLAAGSVLYDNQYSGCVCVATLDTTVEARILGACTASNQQCVVTPEWNTTPDSDDTYKIYLPEGMRIPTVNVVAISDDTSAPPNLELMFDGTGYAGGTTKLDVNTASISANAITATSIAADAITEAKIADNAFSNEHFAAGALTSAEITSAAGCAVASIAANAITATSIAADAIEAAKIKDDAITAAKIATDAIAADAFAQTAADKVWGTAARVLTAIDEDSTTLDLDATIASAVWNALTASYVGAGTTGKVISDTLADTNELQTDDTPTAIAALATTLGVAGAGLTAIPWNAAWDAEVQSECTDALNAYDPPTKAELDSAQAAVTVSAIANNAITAAAIATDAIDADALKADAITEIQNGLATAAALTTVDTVVDLIEDIVRNKMEITDANGNLVLYADDSTTPLYSVAACVTDDLTTTTRKRLA